MNLKEELEEMKDMASKLDAKLNESEEKRKLYMLQYTSQVEKEEELLKWAAVQSLMSTDNWHWLQSTHQFCCAKQGKL